MIGFGVKTKEIIEQLRALADMLESDNAVLQSHQTSESCADEHWATHKLSLQYAIVGPKEEDVKPG